MPHSQGEHFSGWQKQQAHNGREFRTIEATLETALGAALGQAVRFFPAGRTDAGVSAAGQCITFDAMLAPSSPVIAKPPKHLRGECLASARYSFSDLYRHSKKRFYKRKTYNYIELWTGSGSSPKRRKVSWLRLRARPHLPQGLQRP